MDKMLDQQYEKTNIEDHISEVSYQNVSDEISARPDDPSSDHFSLIGIEEDAKFTEAENSE